MRIRGLAVVLAGWIVSSGQASAEPGGWRPEGVWRGPWYLGMSSGQAELQFQAEGIGGTLTLTGNEAFGDVPVEVRDVVLEEGRLQFRARGADGKVAEVVFPIAGTPTKLKGQMRYGGYKYLLELTSDRAGDRR